MLCVIFFVFFWHFGVHTFLLQPNSQQNSGINDQCVSLTEFQSTKETLLKENDELRHKMTEMQIDLKNTIAVLTSQLQAKFGEMEQTVFSLNATKNEEFKCDCGDLERNLSNVIKDLDDVRKNTNKTDVELAVLKQTLEEHDVKLETLRQLEPVKQLETLSSIEQKVQMIETETHSLSVNEQARRNDFMAFRNEFVALQSNVFQLTNKSLENGKNITALHSSTIAIGKQIDTIKSTVAISACDTGHYYSDNTVIKFSNVLTHVGVNRQTFSNFIQTGKFKCESDGLYYVSMSIVSRTDEGRFALFKNGHHLIHGYVSHDSNFQSASLESVIELKSNDLIWFQPYTLDLRVDSTGSCITIFKL